ncbi:hypothetical protein S7711_00125 [Stachybotrys chartarum IBT 7711]|uniref:Zn(2)-C6 fungal-type domain-containing protein n=1 Tax=Stachybotrys chartarum (strain CBS 109288 / IBT 7711) TaxID=1280523 RepID=A0A084B3I2_STACB|nr:hypothetical protein S7711_00125 [Stachybotrys chartarum IBT 7711]
MGDQGICSVCQLPIVEAACPPGPKSSSRQCPFCSAVFSRVDGARRHAKSCSQRDGRTLRTKKRGRKTRSCDQCSRVKVHCTALGQGRCERCASRNINCTLSRCCTDPSHRQSSPEEPRNQHGRGHGRLPLSFLLNVTDDKQDFITEKAVGEEPDGVLLGPTSMTPPRAQGLSDEALDFIDPTLLLPFDPQDSLAPLEFSGLYSTEEQNLIGAFLSPEPQEDRLSAQLHLLERHVAAHASSSDRYGASYDSAQFRRFFSPSNVHTFAMMFCRKRHYQYPLIHWPTFALETVSLPLLMVVALTGATYSYSPGHGPEHIAEARQLYHLADSYIFRQLAIYLDSLPSGEIDVAEAIQLCQAALLMYALDTLLANDPDMQRTAVTERLPALVAAMRRLCFVGCRHDPSEEWQLFLQREQIIRLVSWAYCADCLATMSCNNPPVFSMLEISGDLPCDTILWEADSPSSFALLRLSQPGTSHCLKGLMQKLLDGEFQVDDGCVNVPLFHLHVMLCAFQHIIFNLQTSMSFAQQGDRLLQALSKWRYLWGEAMDKIPVDHRRWLGVSKYVPDIEHLTRRIIEVSASSEATSSQYLKRVPSYGAREMHHFIRDFVSKT